MAAQAGGAWALTILYEHLAPLVVGYLRLQGATEPEDLTSEAFLGAFRNIGAFEGDEHSLRSWLLTIAHRRLLDERRKSGRRPSMVEFDVDAHVDTRGDVEREAMVHLESAQIHRMLAVLPPQQRNVLLLRVVGDLSIAEVSALLGKQPGAIKQLQRRGLKTLKARFDQRGVAR